MQQEGETPVPTRGVVSPLGEQIFLMGELTYLLSHSPQHVGYTVGDMMRFFMAPIRLNQFRIYRTKDRPIGFVAWAYLHAAISEHYATGDYELQVKDWRSGQDLWFVEFIAPFGHAKRIVEELRSNIFVNASARFIRRQDGGVKVVEIAGLNHPNAPRRKRAAEGSQPVNRPRGATAESVAREV